MRIYCSCSDDEGGADDDDGDKIQAKLTIVIYWKCFPVISDNENNVIDLQDDGDTVTW